MRCRSCGKWLCDRCVRPIHGHIFCGWRCRFLDLVNRSRKWVASVVKSPVSPFFAALVITLVFLGAGTWITVLAMRLSAVSGDTGQAPAPLPHAMATTVRDGDTLTIAIQGSPGATVVIFADGDPIRAVTLDDHGRASMADPGITDESVLELAALAGAPEPIASPPTFTPAGAPPRSVTEITAQPPTRPSTPTKRSPGTATPTATTTPTRTSTRTTVPAIPDARKTPPAGGTSASKMSTTSRLSPPVLHLVTDAGNRIAVTFDGNASSNGTTELLDLLKELDLKITLFVTGGFVERYPKIVRRAVLEGHEVGNHTFSHPHLTSYAENRRHKLLPGVSKALLVDQLIRTETAFRKATGRPMAPLWRAPYGEENSALRGWALELGYLHVRWSSLEGASLDSRDWVADEHSSLYQDSRKMMDRLLGFPHLEGGIVLMHLATERSEPPWAELPRFVKELKRRQVKPVKVSDLLDESRTWKKWLEQARENHAKNFPE